MAKKKQKRKASVLKAYNRLIRRASSKKVERHARQAKQEYIDRTKGTFATTGSGIGEKTQEAIRSTPGLERFVKSRKKRK